LRRRVGVTDLGKAWMYYTITFGLCLALAALAPWIGRRTPDIAMFTPLAAVLLMLLCSLVMGIQRLDGSPSVYIGRELISGDWLSVCPWVYLALLTVSYGRAEWLRRFLHKAIVYPDTMIN
jgi:hypothetical protein